MALSPFYFHILNKLPHSNGVAIFRFGLWRRVCISLSDEATEETEKSLLRWVKIKSKPLHLQI